jgi:Protein of unknown function (DUF1761)
MGYVISQRWVYTQASQKISREAEMNGINLWAVLLAGASGFGAGGVWYSPLMFSAAWQKETGQSREKLQSGHPAVIFGVAFLLSLLAAFVFALFLGPSPALKLGLGAGFSAGLCWVAASYGINYLFERRSFRLWLINGGYHTLQFTVYGLVLGLWH